MLPGKTRPRKQHRLLGEIYAGGDWLSPIVRQVLRRREHDHATPAASELLRSVLGRQCRTDDVDLQNPSEQGRIDLGDAAVGGDHIG
jgi:hypothetical protein